MENNNTPCIEMFGREIAKIRDEIAHRCDGPVTRFVLITRTAEAVKAGADPHLAANALYEALVDFDFMHRDDDDC